MEPLLVNQWVPLVPWIQQRSIFGPAVLDGGQIREGVAVEADEDHVEDDSHLDPVLPVEEVLPLRVHQLEGLFAQHDEGCQHEQYLKWCSVAHGQHMNID